MLKVQAANHKSVKVSTSHSCTAQIQKISYGHAECKRLNYSAISPLTSDRV